jgi:hypothetical protein
LIVTTGSLTFDFIENNELLNSLVSFISSLQFYFVLATIGFGFITFYFNRERIETETQLEKEQEDQAERKRAEEFDSKFAFLTKFDLDYGISENWNRQNYAALAIRGLIAPFVWVMRLPYSSGKWMYREGLGYSIPLLIVSLAFIIIKISIPIIYTGSYIDEYNHILSGISFFETGHFAEIYHGSYYSRGAYVSVLVGIFMQIFGETIFAAKMVPATLGIINFFLLYGISKKIGLNKNSVILMLIIYATIPWFIFNHSYIRMYVFYEFFILLNTFLFLMIIENITNIRKLAFFSVSISSILLMVYFYSGDHGKYLVLIHSVLFMAYIFLHYGEKIPIQNKLYFHLTKYKTYKLSLLLIITLLAVFYMQELHLIHEFFNGTFRHTSGIEHKYNNLFFNLNIFFTILFLCSSALLIGQINNAIKIIIFLSILIFFSHNISSLDMQMTRVIIYFLPLFYLVSVISFSKYTKIYNKKIISFLFILLLISSIHANYPDDFVSEAPHIPTEVVYRDYKEASIIVNERATNETILITNLPHIYKFYSDEQNDIYLMRDREASFYNPNLRYQGENDTYYYTASDDPIITNDEMLLSIINNNENVLFLLDDSLYHSWVTKDSREIIEEYFYLTTELKRIKIYEKQ